MCGLELTDSFAGEKSSNQGLTEEATWELDPAHCWIMNGREEHLVFSKSFKKEEEEKHTVVLVFCFPKRTGWILSGRS